DPGARGGGPMRGEVLKGLSPAARAAVAERAFRTGEAAAIDAGPYLIEDVGLGRGGGLAPPRGGGDWGVRRVARGAAGARRAPPGHATLRLTRREAADRRIWAHLATVLLPDYTRWRWRDPGEPGGPAAIDRFVGDEATNAISRPWWIAELTRDGADYG